MNTENVLPVLNNEILLQKANEFAMAGAIETIKDFYSGWNSPFRKAIEKKLSEQEVNFSMGLPDIIALINDGLSKEIDLIANAAIAKTFIPLVQKFLVREEKKVNFSDILKKFIEVVEPKNGCDCNVSIEESSYGWIVIVVSNNEHEYRMCFHKIREIAEGENQHYSIHTLPDDKRNSIGRTQLMKVSLDNVTLEMPFVRDVLQDEFLAYMARLVLGNCLIEMDCRDFDDDMFSEEGYL